MVGSEKSLPVSKVENASDSDSGQNKEKPPQLTIEDLEKILSDLLARRKEHQLVLVRFSKKEVLTRADTERLNVVVKAYEAVIDIDAQICEAQSKWMNLKELKGEDHGDHEYSDVKFDPKMIAFAEEKDNVKMKFQGIVEVLSSCRKYCA